MNKKAYVKNNRYRRRKRKLKLRISFLLSGLLIVGVCFSLILKPSSIDISENADHNRHLTSESFLRDCFTKQQRRDGAVILHLLGMLYMFVGIALACDEFFVPALEEIAETLHLSDDVAGATLMAAGGSAPELFTSLIGTLLLRTDVGFGTIVGSAVFNVLFVIAMCAIFSKEILTLTGYPLARDSLYYTISLLMLSLFFGGISPNRIEWWEALILLFMYFGYVWFMKYNHTFYVNYVYKEKVRKEAASISAVSVARSKNEVKEEGSLEVRLDKQRSSTSEMPGMTRRVSLLNVVGGKTSVLTCEMALKNFDSALANETAPLSEAKVKQILEETGHKGNIETGFSKVDFPMAIKDFKNWYCAIMTKINEDITNVFPNPSFDRSELQNGIGQLETGGSSTNTVLTEYSRFLSEKDIKQQQTSRNQFEEWYRLKFFFDNTLDDEFPMWPDEWQEQFFYIMIAPLMFPMYYTVPDASKSNLKAAISFLVSIIWIGVFSTFMVEWAHTVQKTIDIEPKVMGLTFIAAGTSVPDLISSVIVARQGKGDMAVSSSIGSNIFDILVGLPIPWILGNIIYWEPIKVEIDDDGSLLFSIFVLILMLCSTIATIALAGWKLSRSLAGIMLLLYAIFVTQDLLRAYKIVPSPF